MKINYLYPFLLFILLLFSGCGTVALSDARYEYTEENDAISKEFNSKKELLIFILKDENHKYGRFHRRYNKALKKLVSKYYSGNHLY
jgi:hypothetical protein